MPAVLAALLILAAPSRAPRPPSPREMYGFLLGQYARNVEVKLGKPTSIETDTDGEPLWNYNLEPDGATVLTFAVSKSETPTVTLIELDGVPKAGLSGLLGVTLGMTKADVLQRLGTPDTTEARKEKPGEELDWTDRNYYVELNAAGKVDRVQIVANDEGYPKAGDTKPDLEGFRKALESRDRDLILEWLCADMDVYTKADETVNFVGSAVEDIRNEESLISRYIYGGSGSARDLLTTSLAASAELEKGPGEPGETGEAGEWASIFPDGSPIVNIVWAFEAGRWRVWEIDLNPGDSQRRRGTTWRR